MARSLGFGDNSRWIVLVQMPPLDSNHDARKCDGGSVMLSNKAHCMQLVKERTSVPVPNIFELVTDFGLLGFPFMLMEYVPRDVAMDLNF